MQIRIKRLVACGIDLLPFMVLLRFLTPIIYNVIPNSNGIRTVICIIYYVSLGILVCLKDNFFGNESVGKKIMKLKIVGLNGEIEKDKKMLFERNFYSLFNVFFPMYPYMILFINKSFGDMKTKLEVKEI